jgi:hypothetical protein
MNNIGPRLVEVTLGDYLPTRHVRIGRRLMKEENAHE